jgi:uncharacterized protein YbjT (DUF2867 family)
LVDAAKAAGVKKFVLVSSIGADGPLLNPLNLFWGILFWKKRAEEYLQRSGLESTIVRPGGLVNVSDSATRGRSGSQKRGTGAVVMARPGTYGFPPLKSGAILRSKVCPSPISLAPQNAADSAGILISQLLILSHLNACAAGCRVLC